MSEISRELREQQAKDIGESLKRVLGPQTQTLPANEVERLRAEERIKAIEEKLRAER